ncbi:MAG: hypothetical protein HOO99_11295 [Hyphomicrobiaceae bacterium]|nr:hypothetical protein [Hyphomicrobiaceae bacterium]
MTYFLRVLAAVALLASAISDAKAIDLGGGAMPVAFEPNKPISLPAAGEIRIDGVVTSPTPVTLILRIDDGQSTSYSSRMNDERGLPPGPFSLRFDVANLQASNGRRLNPTDIRRAIVFINGAGTGRITRFDVVEKTSAASVISPNPQSASTLVEIGTGFLPISFEPKQTVMLPTTGEIRIDGLNTGTAPFNLVIRIDDALSSDYMSRMNDERSVAPGPFSLRFDTSHLKATNGRVLDPTRIIRVIAFVNGDGVGTVTRFNAAPKIGPTPAATTRPTAPETQTVGSTVTFATGPFPSAFEPDHPVALPPAQTLQLEGTIDSPTPALLVLRIDDGQSVDYASRMNDEREVPPGPFSLEYDTSNLRAKNGRVLNPSDIRRIIAFIDGAGSGTIMRFAVTPKANTTSASHTDAAAQPSSITIKPGEARAFGKGPLPIVFEPDRPVSLTATHELRINGTISGPTAATLILRVDDAETTDYQSRMNLEHALKPGPFSIRIDVANLRTSNGRSIKATNITRVIAFINGSGTAIATRFDVGPKDGPAIPLASSSTPAKNKSASSIKSGPKLIGPQTLSTGTLPIKYDPSTPVAFGDADEIRVEGFNDGKEPAAVALRIDDGQSSGYPSRFNDERMLPPGPFKLRIGLKGLKAPSGRILDHGDIRRIHLFPWQGSPNVRIVKFETGRGRTLPLGATGYALGADNAPLHPGFERIAPGDQRIGARGTTEAIRRPAPDPLVANGLRGIRTLTLLAPKGRVRVTIWSEDPGEWEELPREFERRIRVNGKDAWIHKMSADQWISERYLRGSKTEHSTTDDAWTAYGKHRGNRRWLDVDAPKGTVVIELSGAEASAYYLSAVLIEPAPTNTSDKTESPSQALVETQRAEWYQSNYPVAEYKIGNNDGGTPIALHWSDATQSRTAPITIKTAPDSGAGIRLDVTSDATLEKPRITITPPIRANEQIPTTIWASELRLERDSTVLKLTDNRLIADTTLRPLKANNMRSYELWFDIAKGSPPGAYLGYVTFYNGKREIRIPIEITVLAVELPLPSKPSGFYLARAPHLSYFPGLAIARDQQLGCDLEFMRRFGLSNTAPPIAGLDRQDLTVFGTDMRRPGGGGAQVTPGWLIYNPLVELHKRHGSNRGAEIVARLETMIKAAALPQPLWSVADEPSNPDQTPGELDQWVKALRAASPGIKLAGHLNTPKDDRYAPLFDTLIINQAFGIEAANISKYTKSGNKVWLYNTFAHRLTAGHWLWNTPAERYVQWHARMPTADPFDPIDGREADFQVIYPTAQVCPKTPDINRDLLRLAEGVVDQRWLLWLEHQPTRKARQLTAELRTLFAGSFEKVQKTSRTDLIEIRNRIMDVFGSP